MRTLPVRAQTFVATVWLLGALAVAGAALAPGARVPGARVPVAGWELALFVVLGMVAGGTRVRLMRSARHEDHGSITLGFVFTFAALLRFGVAPAVLVGTLSMLSSCFFPQRLPGYQTAFNTALIAVSTFAAGHVFLWANGGTLHLDLVRSFPAVLAACAVFFLIEAGAVAGVISLCTTQRWRRLFTEQFLWTAPSYFAAACVGTLALALLGPRLGIALLYLLPVLYLIYQSYAVSTARTREAQQHTEALRDSEERLRLALRAARMGAWDLNLATGEMVWYEGASALLGTEDHTFAGTQEAFLERIHTDDRAYLRQRIEEAAATGTMEEVEFRIPGDDGGTRWLAAVGQIHRNGSGPPVPPSHTGRLGGMIYDITERKRSEELIRWQAHHDALTGLPNRTLLQDRLRQALARAKRAGELTAVLFLDLDRFKLVNDTLGHAAGDYLLQEVAHRLKGCLRAEDTIGRMGGDEFTVLLPSLQSPQDAARVAQKLLSALAPPITIDTHDFYATVSIGISIFPFDGQDAATLLKHADVAMYRAKEEHRGSYQLYTQTMNATALERLVLESHLRKALERDELVLYYQPQIALATGQVTGVEALVRWQHPELGMLSPAQFIPLAEDTGLILPLGEWTLREACRQGVVWQEEGHPITIGVNLSARQVEQRGLAEIVEETLLETGLDPRWLNLELTESAIMQNREIAVEMLLALKLLGIRLSVDDFGTGYSSLSYLRYFPVDTLKVDRTFVFRLAEDATDQALMRTMIDLAHALEMEVIAEGVETPAQQNRLHALGCDAMQGFLFSPPVSADKMDRLLHTARGPFSGITKSETSTR